mgnify:CR=1 FL=1
MKKTFDSKYSGISRPMYIHKRFFIDLFASKPEEMLTAFPDWEGTVEELLKEMRESDKEIFCYGKFLTQEEYEEETELYLSSKLDESNTQ